VELIDGNADEVIGVGGGANVMLGDGSGTLDDDGGKLTDGAGVGGPADVGTLGTVGTLARSEPGLPLPLTTDEQAATANATAEAASANRMRTISLRELSGRP
jgi:hypothetical protein